MKKFLVACRCWKDKEFYEKEMTGNELANLYGGIEYDILAVSEIMPSGKLIYCKIWDGYPEHNVLYVHRLGNYEPYEYEWDEH